MHIKVAYSRNTEYQLTMVFKPWCIRLRENETKLNLRQHELYNKNYWYSKTFQHLILHIKNVVKPIKLHHYKMLTMG